MISITETLHIRDEDSGCSLYAGETLVCAGSEGECEEMRTVILRAAAATFYGLATRNE